MGYMETYKEWIDNPYFDEVTKKELQGIEGNEAEIKERFYADLEFGTAGLRGVIGAGTNRMNIYTVRKATQGLANYVCHQNLRMKRHAVWRRTASKLMYLRACVRRQNCLSLYGSWAVYPE